MKYAKWSQRLMRRLLFSVLAVLFNAREFQSKRYLQRELSGMQQSSSSLTLFQPFVINTSSFSQSITFVLFALKFLSRHVFLYAGLNLPCETRQKAFHIFSTLENFLLYCLRFSTGFHVTEVIGDTWILCPVLQFRQWTTYQAVS